MFLSHHLQMLWLLEGGGVSSGKIPKGSDCLVTPLGVRMKCKTKV